MKKIAIHSRSGSFSDRWIEYCHIKGIEFKLVNGLSLDILEELKDCSAFFWHWHHGLHDEVMVAKHIIKAAELMGLQTFPNTNTCWSFDNKISQRYQLEAIGAPLIPTYIFYNKKSALQWAHSQVWPVVFKLSRGAGSLNVKLVRSFSEAEKLINVAFSQGFRPASGRAADAIARLRSPTDRIKVDWLGKFRRLPITMKAIAHRNKSLGRDIGYVYFQKFIPNNQYDIRITVIGDRAFGFIRKVRENDFRASGSGNISYDRLLIPGECIGIAFNIASRLKTQSIAFDFVLDTASKPLLVETSYCYNPRAVLDCNGYWDPELNWYDSDIWPQDAIIDDIFSAISNVSL